LEGLVGPLLPRAGQFNLYRETGEEDEEGTPQREKGSTFFGELGLGAFNRIGRHVLEEIHRETVSQTIRVLPLPLLLLLLLLLLTTRRGLLRKKITREQSIEDQ